MRCCIVALLVLITGSSVAQIGGSHVFPILSLENSARFAGLAGTAISFDNNELGLAFQNPALLDENDHSSLELNGVDYVGGSGYGYASYAHNFKKAGIFAGHLQYMNYGKMRRFDEFGNEQGNFFAADYNFVISHARPIDSLFRAGASMKFIYSALDQWSSFGVAMDLGVFFEKKSIDLSAGLVARNIGMQLSTYTSGNRENLPFDLALAVTKGLKHAPFRFTIQFDQLHRWDLTYIDPNAAPVVDPLTGEEVAATPPGFFEKLMRHTSYGVELLFGKSFWIASGFDYRRRAELRTESRTLLTGFSVGVGFKIRNFRLAYAHSGMHRAAGANFFTVSTRLDSFGK